LAEFKGITLNQVTKSRLLQLNFRLVKTKQMILNTLVRYAAWPFSLKNH